MLKVMFKTLPAYISKGHQNLDGPLVYQADSFPTFKFRAFRISGDLNENTSAMSHRVAVIWQHCGTGKLRLLRLYFLPVRPNPSAKQYVGINGDYLVVDTQIKLSIRNCLRLTQQLAVIPNLRLLRWSVDLFQVQVRRIAAIDY
jgi:hypothetical protein